MAWLFAIVVFLIFVGLMVSFPAFRILVLSLLIVAGVGGYLLYEYNQNQEKRKLSAIAPSELEMSDITLIYDYGYKFTATVKNNSRYYAIQSIAVIISAFDCPLGDPLDWAHCDAIGQDDLSMYSPIPIGQVRRINGGVTFRDMPPIKRRFVWSYQVSQIKAQ